MKTAAVMCTYNGMKYLRAQLDSLRLQTKRIDRVVIRDDGSSDDTVEYIKSYISEFGLTGWSVQVNEVNLGFAENFHVGALDVEDCCDIVFFSDQDDVWELNKVSRCCEVMEEHPEVMLLCHEYDVLNTEEQLEPARGVVASAVRGDGSLEQIPAHNGGVFIWLGCAMACKSDFLQCIEEYRFEGWAHDEWTWKCAQALGGCYMLHESLCHHRVHGGNLTGHKVRSRSRRADEAHMKMLGDEAALRLAEDVDADASVRRVFARSAKCEKLRYELLGERKLSNALRLIPYLDAYQSKRSWPVELIIAARGER